MDNMEHEQRLRAIAAEFGWKPKGSRHLCRRTDGAPSIQSRDWLAKSYSCVSKSDLLAT
jgi:hypothetical protein